MTTVALEESPYYRVKKVKGHNCQLNYEEETVANYVHSGPFIPLRRFIRKSLMISIRDPRTKAYAKSLSRMINEERRHLERYYYTIHPFSDFHFVWQTVMTITNLLILIITPTYFLKLLESKVLFVALLTNMFFLTCFVNIFICFFIGFHDKTIDKVVLQPKKVTIRYLITHFTFDVITTFNYNLIAKNTGYFQPIWYMRFQTAPKLFRLITINQYLDNVQMRLGLSNYFYRTMKYSLFTCIGLLWLNFFTYAIDVLHERSVIASDSPTKFFSVMHKNLQRLFLCDMFKGYYESVHAIDLYVAVATLHFGKFFEIWLLAQIFQISSSYMLVTQKNQTLMHQVKAFTRFKDLPKRICRRINGYLNFRLQCMIFNEKALIDNLSSTLRAEIFWHRCQSWVMKVETFRDLPSSIMMKLATVLKPEIYLPNDVVVHTGDVGSEMFFVYVGVLAVFTESGKEICHLSDGTHFGEIALLLNEPRIASVVAVDFCELYRLTKEDFQEAIEPYPQLKENILKAAHERFRETRILVQE